MENDSKCQSLASIANTCIMSSPMTVKIAVIVWTGGPILEMAYVQ